MSPSSSGRSGRKPPRPRPRSAPSARSVRGSAGGTAPSPQASSSRRKAAPRPDSGTRKRGPRFARFLKGLGILTLLLLVAFAVTGFAVYASMSRQLPDPDLTKARGRDQSTTITDRNGKLLVRLYAEENRKDIPLADIPPQLRQAVVATEDKRFYEHEGVDPISIARALVVDIIRGEKAQGGSTITQQYVKQAFVGSEKTVKRKIQEAILAQKVERRYSKDEILELYLNTIYFGHGAYGVEAASRVYFGKGVKKLTLPEAAMLAGVIKSPGRYSPYLEPEAALSRRNLILGLMATQGYVPPSAAAEAAATEVVLEGLKPRSTAAPYFVEWIKGQLVEEYGEREVYRGGLAVKTTLDLGAQRAAEKAVGSILDKKNDPSAALVAIKPDTGEVIAMVGGRDFAKQQFNVAVQGRRQPGSAFKTFVVAAALAESVSPEATYTPAPIKIPVGSGTWSVTGISGAKAPMRLRVATEKSINAVFAQLIMDVGPDKVVEMAQALGVDSEIEPVPAIALGGLGKGVSPLEMTESYATLAANGRHAEPFGIQEVKDASGEVLLRAKPRRKTVIDPAVAYLTTDMLRGVITRGTGTSAKIGRPAAGKTGTTQQYRDAWFVGYTPDLACAVWVGYPESQKEMTSVHGIRVTGGSFPARIWASFMTKALDKVEKSAFEKPDGLITKVVCADSGSIVTPNCPNRIKALLLKTSRVEDCALHRQPAEVKVPRLVGASKDDALARLAQLGLVPSVTERAVAGVASGIVAEQDPPPGTKLKPGSKVKLVVATGATANEPPTAIFSAPTDARAGKAATLDASASTDDGTIKKYLWEFGDGTTKTGKTVTHTWATAGTYDVTLWVTDNQGAQASVTHRVTVR